MGIVKIVINEHLCFFMEDCGGKDLVVMQALSQGWFSYEVPVPLLLAKFIQNNQTCFIDIGANTGFYSLLAASLKAQNVIAFEPVPVIFNLLKKNIHQSNFSSIIEIHQIALSDHSGSGKIFMPDDSHGLIETSASLNPEFKSVHSGEIEITMLTLDHFFAHRDFFDREVLVKIDVESYEPFVIKGGMEFIKKFRPSFFIEILPGTDLSFYKNFIEQCNYSHYFMAPNAIGEDPSLLISGGDFQFNRLFLPNEKKVKLITQLLS